MPKTTDSGADTAGQYVRRTVLNPKKISITDAAKLLGVGRPTLSNFLNGKAAVSKDMAARIERAFGIPAEKLLDLQAAHDAVAMGAEAPTKAAGDVAHVVFTGRTDPHDPRAEEESMTTFGKKG